MSISSPRTMLELKNLPPLISSRSIDVQ